MAQSIPAAAELPEQPMAAEPGLVQYLGSLLQDKDQSLLSTMVLILIAPILLFSLKKVFYPTVDRREPPIVRPRLPFIGHIVSLIRERASWYKRLYRENPLPIFSLPMLHGKMYVINSPDLVHAAMKNLDISFEPFLLEFSVGLLGLSGKIIRIIEQRHVMDALMGVIHSTLMGESLSKMNLQALTVVAETLNAVQKDSPILISDTYIWMWEFMGVATMIALLGRKNPYTAEHIHLIREFEQGIPELSFGYAPGLLAPKALQARTRLTQLLKPYYVAGYETRPDVSDLIQQRAEKLRVFGFDDDDLGKQEITFPWAGSTNTIPNLFWFFVHVFSRPDVVERISAEIEAVATFTNTEEGRVATIKAKTIDKECPFLHACYRETLRLYVHNVGVRRTMKETSIKDAQGREYLLKKGINVQWSSSLTHLLQSVWGEDAYEFKPERFLNVSSQEEKRRRGANIPFGGGKYLCPGRNFALAESLGFIGVLATGFEVTGVQVPDSEDPPIGTGSRKPLWGSVSRGAKIQRKAGWEDVTWNFA